MAGARSPVRRGKDEPLLAYRLSIASRILAAIVGGYALTTLITFILPMVLPLIGVNPAEAMLWGLMMSFLIYAAIIMAVFHLRTAKQAWIWLVGASLPCLLIVWLFFEPVSA